MINKIIKYEFRLLKSDFGLIVIIFSSIIFLSFFNSFYKISAFNDTYNQIAIQEKEIIDKSQNEAKEIEAQMLKDGESLEENRRGVRSPSNLGNKGTNVMLKTTDFSNLAIGLYDLYPIIYTVNNLTKDSSTKNIEKPLSLFVGNFDPCFVILYLYPIFIIILSFDIIAGEKEKGLLKILLTQSISLNTLIWGKILVRALIIFSTVIFSFLISLIVSGVNIFSSDNITKTLLLISIIVIYGGFWFSLSIFVNSLKTKAVTNAMTLSIIWLVFLLIIPSLINLSANYIYPIPSRIGYVEAISKASEEARLKGSKLLGQFMEDHPELSGKNIDTSKVSVIQTMRDEKILKKTKPINDSFNNQINKQKEFIDKLQFLSPAIVAQEIIYDISGSGIDRLQNYSNQLNDFQKIWRNFFVTKIFDSKPLYANDYNQLPKFNYVEETKNDILNRTLIPNIFLFTISLVIYFLARKRYKKYSIAE